MSDVFCDWLDVTCHPQLSFLDAMDEWCLERFPVAFEDDQRRLFSVGDGKLCLDRKFRFHRCSSSGLVLATLRSSGLYGAFLCVLASVPHKVTRLDAALDVPIDAPLILRELEHRYPDDKVSLSRKSLRVTRVYSVRESDGQLTGTWYSGHRTAARVTARVYDKQAEALLKRGEELPPTTRYELTFRKDLGCTLRDAYMPSSVFYEYAHPTLLSDRPDDVPSWQSHAEPWINDEDKPDYTFKDFQRRVDDSPEFSALAKLASRFGPGGVELVMGHMRRRLVEELEQAQRSSESSDKTAA